MKIIVSTHQGQLYNEDVDYIVVHNQDGEFAIMKNCLPIISIISLGYIKLVRDKMEYYVVVINGVLEYNDNLINVLAGEAHIGETSESALTHLNAVRKERLEENKRKNVVNTEMERDLAESIKKSRAGHL